MDIFKDLDFIVELEKMKSIFRRTKIIGSDRRENDAEHSWHVSTMALFLSKYSREKIDVNKAIKLLLVHDLVELYAGDTFAFDPKANEDKKKRELDALKLIKEKLSKENAHLFSSLWLEFEEANTKEAIFANAMDRLQPLLSNINHECGGTWKEFSVKKDQVLKRAGIIENFNEDIYSYILDEINLAVEKGHIIDS